MANLTESQLRSLVALLDDEDPKSLDMVRSRILELGERVLPYLDDFRVRCPEAARPRVDLIKAEVRSLNLKEAFTRYAAGNCDLEEGTWLVCRFGYPGVQPAVYSDWLDKVAAAVRQSLAPKSNSYSTLQRLNHHLFHELGFMGNEEHYYDPDNSYLHRVIETRRGIPVTLSVLYLLIAKRLELPVFGVGAPGHFMVGYREASRLSLTRSTFIDTFHKGRFMTLQDVRRMLLRSGYQFRPEFLDEAAPREIVARLMRNLIAIYQKAGSPERVEILSSLVEILLTVKPR